jgi:hypothetical protein
MALGAFGVHAVVARPMGAEPRRWLDERWAPLVSGLAAIGWS